MELLSNLTFIILFIIIFNPTYLGKWIGKVINGIGTITINKNINIDENSVKRLIETFSKK